MVRIVVITLLIVSGFVFLARFAIENNAFFQGGIMEGLQACKTDSDCNWVPTGCCGCDRGGRELVINQSHEFIYNLLVKEICLGEYVCPEENICHDEEIYCDRSCKYGERSYTKPILSR